MILPLQGFILVIKYLSQRCDVLVIFVAHKILRTFLCKYDCQKLLYYQCMYRLYWLRFCDNKIFVSRFQYHEILGFFCPCYIHTRIKKNFTLVILFFSKNQRTSCSIFLIFKIIKSSEISTHFWNFDTQEKYVYWFCR